MILADLNSGNDEKMSHENEVLQAHNVHLTTGDFVWAKES